LLIGDQVSSAEILRNVALFDQLAAADLELWPAWPGG
jgi:hypothetical protein